VDRSIFDRLPFGGNGHEKKLFFSPVHDLAEWAGLQSRTEQWHRQRFGAVGRAKQRSGFCHARQAITACSSECVRDNLNGQVVGINKAIVSETGGSIGISFATPINLIKEILPQLESQGKVTRGWAGISIQELNSALAETLGLEKPTGALVAGVIKDGPAYRGGMSAIEKK